MYWEDIEIGTQILIPETELTGEELIAFSRQYVPAPIHIDEAYAATTRFGRLIAPGILPYLKISALYMGEKSFSGRELVAGMEVTFEWKRPVFAGDRLHGVLTATAKTPRTERDGILEQTLEIYNQDGLLTTRCRDHILVRRRPKD